jgi:hypothetical protein
VYFFSIFRSFVFVSRLFALFVLFFFLFVCGSSGRVHELRIHIPWTALGSEAVVITVNTIECVLALRDDRGMLHARLRHPRS